AIDGEVRVFIVSGEVSGNNIGSRLMASLKMLSPLPLRFHGVGGKLHGHFDSTREQITRNRKNATNIFQSNEMNLLKDSFQNLVTLIHVTSNSQVDHHIGESLCEWPVPVMLVPTGSTQLKYDAFAASQPAFELQLAQLPSLVAYQAHFLTELLIRYKAKLPYIYLPNILLDSPIIP
ncbi:unnamed protein product, partial [Thlaspi arvense]